MFRAYWRIDEIEDRDYTHVMVNHEECFVDEDGNHTNHIEATWGVLKRAIPPRVRSKDILQPYLFEQMWRDQHRGCTWDAFLHALKFIKYEGTYPMRDHGYVPSYLDYTE